MLITMTNIRCQKAFVAPRTNAIFAVFPVKTSTAFTRQEKNKLKKCTKLLKTK